MSGHLAPITDIPAGSLIAVPTSSATGGMKTGAKIGTVFGSNWRICNHRLPLLLLNLPSKTPKARKVQRPARGTDPSQSWEDLWL
jgi:hypothetical protein